MDDNRKVLMAIAVVVLAFCAYFFWLAEGKGCWDSTDYRNKLAEQQANRMKADAAANAAANAASTAAKDAAARFSKPPAPQGQPVTHPLGAPSAAAPPDNHPEGAETHTQ